MAFDFVFDGPPPLGVVPISGDTFPVTGYDMRNNVSYVATITSGWVPVGAGGGGAPLNSPHFTDIPTAPTAALGNDTTQLATTAFVLANAVVPGVIKSGLLAEYRMSEGSGTVLTDSSGNGNNGTLGAGAAAPSWISRTGGLTFVQANAQIVTLPAALNSALTIMLFTGFQATGAFASNTVNSPVGGNSVTHGIHLFIQQANPAFGYGGQNQVVTEAFSFTGGLTANRQPCIGINSLALVMDTLDHIYVNGVEASNYLDDAANANQQTAGAYQLGGGQASWAFQGNIYYAVFYNRALSQNEIIQNHAVITAALYNRGVILETSSITDATNTLVVDGDSITVLGWPASMVLNSFNTPPAVWVTAYGGTSLQYPLVASLDILLVPDAATVIDPYFESRAGQNAVFIFAGTNDIAAGATAAQVHTALGAYCKARQTVGWKVFVATMLSRGGFDAGKNAYNDLIRANWTTYADALVDFAAIPQLGADGAFANLTYFQAGGLHPTPAGEALLSSTAQIAINRFYGNTNYTTAITHTSSATQVDAEKYIILGASAGSQTFTLETSVGYTAQNLYITNQDTHSWTIACNGSETIDGAATSYLVAGESAVLQAVLVSPSAGGDNWLRIS